MIKYLFYAIEPSSSSLHSYPYEAKCSPKNNYMNIDDIMPSDDVECYEVDVHYLSEGALNIRDKIYNEPERIFVYKDDAENWIYFGIDSA